MPLINSRHQGIENLRTRPSLLTFSDFDGPEIQQLLGLTRDICADEQAYHGTLAGRFIGMMFNKPSTRTRISFLRAARDLGADVVCLDDSQTQLSTGETHSDTGRILSLFLDCLVVRSNGPLSEMRDLSSSGLPIVNAMSSCEHPTQALADYAAMHKHFGETRGLRIAYFGEGNNTVSALAKLFGHIAECQLYLYMPRSYSLDPTVITRCAAIFKENGGSLHVQHDLSGHLPRVDVVYCTRWRTMGVGHSDPDWLADFQPFKMAPELFARVAAPQGVFMHDLPSVRDEDVSSQVLDGPSSIVWEQAYCKKVGAVAALLFALGQNDRTVPVADRKE